jgi:hypothetical protein
MTKKQQLIVKLVFLSACWALVRMTRAVEADCGTLKKQYSDFQECIAKQPLAPSFVLKQCGLCFAGAPIVVTGPISDANQSVYSALLKEIKLQVYKDPSAVSWSIPMTSIMFFLANQKEYEALKGKSITGNAIAALYKKGGSLYNYNAKKPHDMRYRMRETEVNSLASPIKIIATPTLAEQTYAIGVHIEVQTPFSPTFPHQSIGNFWLSKGGTCTIQVPNSEGMSSEGMNAAPQLLSNCGILE